MRRPDLHLHTTASDGQFDVWQVARLVARADVTLFAITDHDTLDALPAAADAAYERGLAFLPGVEISTEGDEEVHILGYGVRHDDPVLNEFFRTMREDRVNRVRLISEKLKALGMELPIEEIIAGAGSSVGRPHIGRALAAHGFVQNTAEAFDRFIGKGKPAYVPRLTPTAAEAIRLLRSRGAVPVLAHPGEIRWPMERVLEKLTEWQQAGLMGLEVYHPANRGHCADWDAIARERHLLVTGGSDFHGEGTSHGMIGETAAEWPNALQDAWKLYRLAKQNESQGVTL